MFKTRKQIIKNKSSVRVRSEFLLPSSWKLSGQSSSRETAEWDTSSGVCLSLSSETQGQSVGPGEKARGAGKVFKHGRKSPWVPTLTGPFPNSQANAGSWLGTKNALYYCDQSANSFSWVLFVSSYTAAIISPQLPPWFSCYYFPCRWTYQKQSDALKYHTSTISSVWFIPSKVLKKERLFVQAKQSNLTSRS